MAHCSEFAVFVMAKPAAPGHVKTRLVKRLSLKGGAAAHQAMLDCVLERLHTAFLKATAILAVDTALGSIKPPPGWKTVDQGRGDLGERMAAVWRRHASQAAVAFFGADSPDVPSHFLAAIGRAIAEADVVLGRSHDGGYWTLAAKQPHPALFAGIDWGTSTVYDQTRSAAERAGLRVADAGEWFDVDEPADLDALLQRLEHATEPPLITLRQRLYDIIKKDAAS